MSVANNNADYSTDKKLMVWRYQPTLCENEGSGVGTALRALTGHSQPIQDLSLSSNGRFGLTGSWGASQTEQQY